MKVSFFETVRYRPRRGRCRPSGRWPRARTIPRRGAQAYRDMLERLAYVEELGFDWVSVSEHHYSPRILTPSPDRLRRLHRRPLSGSPSRCSARSCPTAIRCAWPRSWRCSTRWPGAGWSSGCCGDGERGLTYDLNPAEARERTDEGMELILQGVDGAAALRLAGPPLPVPDHLDLAASAAAAPSADLRAGHEPGVVRVRRATPTGLRRVLRAVRGHGEGHALLPRAVCAPRLGAEARADRLPGEHARGRDRRRRPRAAARAAEGAPFTMRAGVRERHAALDSRNIAGEARHRSWPARCPPRSSAARTRSSSRCGAAGS